MEVSAMASSINVITIILFLIVAILAAIEEILYEKYTVERLLRISYEILVSDNYEAPTTEGNKNG